MSKETPNIARKRERRDNSFSLRLLFSSYLLQCRETKKQIGLRRWCLLGLAALFATLTSACADFSVLTRNNGHTTTACVDRDLADGDACVPASQPASPPESGISVLQ